MKYLIVCYGIAVYNNARNQANKENEELHEA